MADLERVLRDLAGPPPDLDLDAVAAGARRRRRAARTAAGGGAVALLALVVATAWLVRASAEPDSALVAGPDDEVEVTSDADVVFDPPEGVAGAVVALTAVGLEELAGREAAVWLDHPTYGLVDIVRGTVSPGGRLTIDVPIPNVVEHEHWVTPGRYPIRIAAVGEGPDGAPVVALLDVVAARVGERHRIAPGYECFDYLWFDARLWVGEVDRPAPQFAAPGILTLASVDEGRLVTEDGTRVDMHAATAAEAAAFDPELFQCPVDPESTVVRERDRDLIADLVRFAEAPGPQTAASLAFAANIDLGLSDLLVARRPSNELTDRDLWLVDDDQFRSGTFAGPFSALDLLAREGPVDVTVGPHPHCASPPVPPPPAVAHLRRVSAQPSGIDTCLKWFTVDVFVDANYVIHAVTLDLWEP